MNVPDLSLSFLQGFLDFAFVRVGKFKETACKEGGEDIHL